MTSQRVNNFNVAGVDYRVEYLEQARLLGPDQIHYLYFSYGTPYNKRFSYLVIGITDIMLFTWGNNKLTEELLVDFCFQVIPYLLPKGEIKDGQEQIKVVFHRDDNVARKEGVTYIKADETPDDTARKLVFGSDKITNTQIRRKILEILYNNYQQDPHKYVSTEELRKLIPVEYIAIERNLKYLEEGNHIEARKVDTGYSSAIINKFGIDIFEDQVEFNKTFPIKIEQQTINISGDLISSVVVGNENKVLIKSQIRDAFKEIEYEIGSSDLSDKGEVLTNLKELEEDLKTDVPDPSKVKGLMDKLGEKANWVNRKILSHPILAQIIAELLLKYHRIK